jgi:hypothetical protein
MSSNKLSALAVVVFLLMAVFTGATTAALLSDRATVTTTLSFGAGNTGPIVPGAGNTATGTTTAGNTQTGAGNMGSGGGSISLDDGISIDANASEPDVYPPDSG